LLSFFLNSVGLDLWLRGDNLWEILVVFNDGVLKNLALALSWLNNSLFDLLLTTLLLPVLPVVLTTILLPVLTLLLPVFPPVASPSVGQLTSSLDIVLHSMLVLLEEVEVAGESQDQ